jgi:hypothetical protein
VLTIGGASVWQTCTISGSDQKLPFVCPADTFMRLDALPPSLFLDHGAWSLRMASYLNDQRVRPLFVCSLVS